jgi:hypothetical protein
MFMSSRRQERMSGTPCYRSPAMVTAIFLVRPDGYLGYVAVELDAEALVKHLRLTFA